MNMDRFSQFLFLVLLAFGTLFVMNVQAAEVLFSEDFEGGPVLGPCWEVTGTNEYRTEVTTSNGPHGGSYHLVVDDYNAGGLFSRNEVTLTVDLADYEEIQLAFWAKSFSDEPHGPPPIPFTGGYDFDGVAVSQDGNNWYEVQDLRSLSGSYSQIIVDLDSAVAPYGLNYNSTFKIRFNQYDNYPVTSDGISIDDIEITGLPRDDLSITPFLKFVSSGYEGGIFEPEVNHYTLTNTGPNSISWIVAEVNDIPWLDVSPSGGTLDPNESIVVSALINASADSLTTGLYEGAIRFTNSTSGAQKTRSIELLVKQMPPDGWASMNGGTTGGAGGTVVEVDSAQDFKTYVEANEPYIVEVTRAIDLASVGGTVSITSNKTIRGKGLGMKPTIRGSLLFVPSSTNIIIKGLAVTNPDGYGDGDGMTVMWQITNLFITQCDVYNCPDGGIDITRGSDFVTVSWCKFYYTNPAIEHRFVNLIGNSDDSGGDDQGHLRVTFHHNWWSTMCHERMPRVRFGQVHVYNNYYGCSGNNYCIGVGVESQLRVENNYFDDVDDPWEDYGTSGYTPGKIGWNNGNVFYSTAVPTWAANEYDTIFVPPYPYVLDPGEDVKEMVTAGAGAPNCYGDFDRDNLIDYNDLAIMADYWLDSVVKMEYYIDGTLNFREYSLMMQNWGNTDFTPPSAPQGLTAVGGDGQILLDWSDNSEPDLAGYDVYRSLTWDNHTKINSSLVTDSNYTDSNVVNAAAYFYFIKAIDTSGNDSSSSEQVSGIPLPAGSIIIQENETGYCGFSGFGSVSLIYDGYTGTGFCNTNNMVGNGIIWSIEVPTTGVYTFTWRHSNGTTDSPANLLVDDVIEVSAISFPNTGDWESWETVSQDVTLTAGVRNIKLLATTSKGLSSIDYIMVTGDNPQPAACP